MPDENSSNVDTDIPVNGDDVSGRPSFNHRIVMGGSPLMTEQNIFARFPSSKKPENGEWMNQRMDESQEDLQFKWKK